jgi:diguanylate cyclase (GGDEF)-like protein
MARSGLLSLRTVLTVPYVLLTLALAATIAVLSYASGKAAVARVSDHLLTSTALRTSQAIDRHLVMSRVALEAVLPAADGSHAGGVPDFVQLEQRLSIASSLNPDPNHYVYYGNREGQFLGVNRLGPDKVEVRFKGKASEPRRFSHVTSGGRVRTPTLVESTIYDPRERPWYRRAVQIGSDGWAPIYVDYRTKELVTTRTKVVRDGTGAVSGVLATDVSLKALSEFLSALNVSQEGVAFIVEPDGALVATSTGEKLFHGSSDAPTRVRADTSSNELVRQAYANLAPTLATATARGAPHLAEVAGAKDTFAIAAHQVKDDAGLKWTVMVAVPNKEFMGDVGRSVMKSALIGITTAIIVVLLGLYIVNWVARDLRLLTEATSRLREGHPYEPLNINRQDEIGALAKSFERMHLDLQTDELTGAFNRETFTRVLDRKLREAQQANAGNASRFGIVFIDLKDFKRINDRFGHLAGDHILVEVAQRLKQAMRVHDIVARYAGDEFVILCGDAADRHALEAVSAKLTDALELPFGERADEDGNPLRISASIGTALFPDDGMTMDDLINRADARMYQQKRSGKKAQLRVVD